MLCTVSQCIHVCMHITIVNKYLTTSTFLLLFIIIIIIIRYGTSTWYWYSIHCYCWKWNIFIRDEQNWSTDSSLQTIHWRSHQVSFNCVVLLVLSTFTSLLSLSIIFSSFSLLFSLIVLFLRLLLLQRGDWDYWRWSCGNTNRQTSKH